MDQSFIGKRMEPAKFYALAEVIKSVSEKKVIDLDKIKFKIDQSSKIIFEDYSQISKSNSSFMRTSLSSIKRKTNPFGSLESQDEEAEKYKNTISGTNTLFVLNESLRVINSAWNYLNDVANNLVPGTLILSDERFDSKKLTAQDLQNMVYEFELNSQVMSNFVAAVLALKDAKKEFLNSFISFKGVLERYYRYLNERHSTEGIKVYHNPILVDIAILIHENIDAHGELEQGKKVDEISAYSLNKAYALVETFNKGICSQIIQTPNLYIEYIIENMKSVWQACSTLNEMFKDEIFKIEKIINKYNSSSSHSIELEFDSLLESFMDLDPQNVNYVDKVTIRSPEERHVFNFTNETIEYIANSVKAGLSSRAIVRKVLERKSELTKFFREENSFYTCKIGSGNPFLGEAPGALQIYPGQRPNVNFDEIRGSGFDELNDFFKQVKETEKFKDLFLATSPSKSAGKSNVLLAGPPGCHRKGQKILMFDGSLSNVEDIKVGDFLMGPDSKPRTVLSLVRGIEDMVEIIPTKGKSWVVNKGHILSLVRQGRKKNSGQIKDISILEYMNYSSYMKRELQLFRTGVEFSKSANLPLEPYFLGLLLGDGSITACPGLTIRYGDEELVKEVYNQADKFNLHVNKSPGDNCARYYISGKCHHLNPIMDLLRSIDLGGESTATKFIPHVYKTALRKERLDLLAGIIDTDGSLTNNCYDFQSKSEKLANDVVFVARSLGFAAYIRSFQRNISTGHETYYRVKISGEISEIPVRLPYKKASVRRQIKNVLRTGFKICTLPPEEYFGFTLDGDHRYLLDDFTVTHNCGKTLALKSVGSDNDSISIFAQGSDFLTCWKGEANKNPKRLFEAGLKLHKESGKNVYFLIDEIDSVLNNDRDPGETNLSLEFQILMDGVVQYPGLSLYGATNFPERIPAALLRRFKYFIVGELSQEERVILLKQYIGFMPIKNFSQEDWENAAARLDGATGDIVRKVADDLWRKKMFSFTHNHEGQALDFIKWLNRAKKFDLSSFLKEDKEELSRKLAPYVSVDPYDLNKVIDLHMKNPAVISEVMVAVQTYKRAKEILKIM